MQNRRNLLKRALCASLLALTPLAAQIGYAADPEKEELKLGFIKLTDIACRSSSPRKRASSMKKASTSRLSLRPTGRFCWTAWIIGRSWTARTCWPVSPSHRDGIGYRN